MLKLSRTYLIILYMPQKWCPEVTIGNAVAYVLSGMYGSVCQLGAGNAILIIVQLCFAGLTVICLEELDIWFEFFL